MTGSLQSSPFRLGSWPGSWLVEPTTGFLRRDGEELRLEPRVLALLCLLASQPGQVFSKEEIFEAVWKQSFVEDSTLTRSISDLRRALGDDARDPRYIQTLPKKGYRCIAAVTPETLETASPLGQTAAQKPTARIPICIVAGGAALALLALALLALAVLTSANGWLASKDDSEPLAEATSLSEPVPGVTLSAYDYYLAGRDHYKRYRKGDNLQAIALYRKALDVDPSFALAHAELANALAVQKGNFHLPGPWVEQALASAHRAIELQPTLPEAHKALAHALSLDDKLSLAVDHYRKALELRPDYHEATHNLSLLLHMLGRHDEAFEGFQRYHAAGRMSADSAQHVGWIYYNVGENAKAEEWFRRSLEREPYHIGSQRGLALLELRQGDIAAARRRWAALREVQPDCPICLVEEGDLELATDHPEEASKLYRHAFEQAGGSFPLAALRLGQTLRLLGGEDAESWLHQAEDAALEAMAGGVEDPWVTWIAAAAAAQLGHPDQALDFLRTALAAGWQKWDLDDPVFASLRPDPRYLSMLRQNEAGLRAMRDRISVASRLDA